MSAILDIAVLVHGVVVGSCSRCGRSARLLLLLIDLLVVELVRVGAGGGSGRVHQRGDGEGVREAVETCSCGGCGCCGRRRVVHEMVVVVWVVGCGGCSCCSRGSCQLLLSIASVD